jgi:hypothetical protein
MISKWKSLVAAGLSAVVIAAPAQGQWRSTAIGVAEYDTQSTLFLLGGISASPGGRAIAPLFGVQAYHLRFDTDPGTTTVSAVKPYVGLSRNYGNGSFYGTVGYAFSNRDNSALVRTTSTNDIGDGIVVAGGWDHWGASTTPWGHQVLASYNTDSENFWGRGRVTRRISQSGAAQRRLGAELALGAGDNYTAWQPGAILEFHNGRGSILGLGAGMKLVDGDDNNAFYFKVEGVLPVMR